MVRCLFFVLLLMAGWQTQAQVRLGVKGGLNLSKFHMSDVERGTPLDFTNRPGFHAGILAEIPMGNILSFQPELLLSWKGAKYKSYREYTNVVASGYSYYKGSFIYVYTPFYVELPLYLKVGINLGNTGKLTGGIGPYIACGVGGKWKIDVDLHTYGGSMSYINGSDDGELKLFKKDQMIIDLSSPPYSTYTVTFDYRDKAIFKRFDTGLSAFAGYELNMGIFATVGYDFGLYNIVHGDDKLYNRTFSISAGYKF